MYLCIDVCIYICIHICILMRFMYWLCMHVYTYVSVPCSQFHQIDSFVFDRILERPDARVLVASCRAYAYMRMSVYVEGLNHKSSVDLCGVPLSLNLQNFTNDMHGTCSIYDVPHRCAIYIYMMCLIVLLGLIFCSLICSAPGWKRMGIWIRWQQGNTRQWMVCCWNRGVVASAAMAISWSWARIQSAWSYAVGVCSRTFWNGFEKVFRYRPRMEKSQSDQPRTAGM